jgi:hypothetical protein
MTIRSFTAAAVIAAASGAACLVNAQVTPAKTEAMAVQSELEVLKAQLAALQERLAQLEAAQKSQSEKTEAVVAEQAVVNTDLQDSIDRTSDNLARTVGDGASSGWMGRWVWKGDLRVRNEHIDQEATAVHLDGGRLCPIVEPIVHGREFAQGARSRYRICRVVAERSVEGLGRQDALSVGTDVEFFL